MPYNFKKLYGVFLDLLMIRKIILKNFRNYSESEITFNSTINVFIGRNGQGKSNLLEAIFFIGMLRSFRACQIADVKMFGQNFFYLAAEIERKKWSEFLEIEYSEPEKRKLLIDGKAIFKTSEFIKIIKTIIFSPEDITIITGSSAKRRRFIDILISILNPSYLTALHKYTTALKSRNAALKSGDGNYKVAEAFEYVLAETGVIISSLRTEYSNLLTKEVNNLLNEFIPEKRKIEIIYNPSCGTDNVNEYLERFNRERTREIKRGFTGFGPQIDDFDFIYQGISMRNFASTGQCRLISLCLKMAEVNIISAFNMEDNSNIIVLVDDVTGELDEITRRMFFRVINKAGQAFFTFTEKPSDSYFENACFYKVDNGKIS